MTDRQLEIAKLVDSGLTYKEIANILNTTVMNVGSHYKKYKETLNRIERANQILDESNLKDKLVIYKGDFAYSSKYHTDQRDIGYLRVDDKGYIAFYHFGKNNINLSRCHHIYPIKDFELLPDYIAEYINEQINKPINKVTDLENKIAKTEKLLEKYKAELQVLREEDVILK